MDYEPQFTTSFSGAKTYQSYWGRGAGITAIGNTYASIAVSTSPSSISASQPMVISRQVQLQILYYQVKRGQKRIVTGKLLFIPAFQCHTLTNLGIQQQALEASGVVQCVLNSLGTVASTYYQLEVVYQPLAYMYLFNHFSYTELIYMLAFLMTGFITIGLGAILYGIHRLMTRVRHPKYHGYPMLVAVVQPMIFGCFLGILPVMLGVVAVYGWFMGGAVGGHICSATPLINPSVLCLETITDWLGLYTLDQLRNGRKGLLLIFIGWYSLYAYTLLIVPVWTEFDVKPDAVRAAELLKKKIASKDKRRIKTKVEKSEKDKRAEEVEEVEKVVPSSIWKVHIWKRANIMLLAMFVVMLLVTHMELSYSTPFQLNVYSFIVFFQIFYFIAEELMFKMVCSNVMVSML